MIGKRRQRRDEPEPVVPPVDERERLRQHIEREAGFRVTTVDGLNWICPYTLTVVPAPFDVLTAALDFLIETKPWATAKPRPVADLLVVRWTRFLNERWEFEPRLHLHGPDGQWLNPWTGGFVPIPGNQARSEVIAQRARSLAALPQAQLVTLLDAHQLEATVRKRSAVAPPPMPTAPAPAPTTTPRSDTWQRPPPVGADSPPSQKSPALSSGVRSPAPPAANAATTSSINRTALGDVTRARAVLDRMLPKLPVLPGYRMAVQFEPVQGIGGDFYDIIPIAGGRWLIVMGDVSGHGAEAALIVTSCLKALRLLAPGTADLVNLLVKLNDTMRPDLPSGHFITMWAGILDPASRLLTHVCAGHHPALLLSLRRTATLQQVGKAGTALGVVGGATLRARLTEGQTQLEPGDLLVQFTDGLFEVNSPNGIEFGHLRLMGSCVANLEHPPEVMASRLVKEVKKFTAGGLDDDLTLLVLGVDL